MQYTRILAGAATLLFASQAFADVPPAKKADEKKTEPSKEDAGKSDSKKVEAGKDATVKTEVAAEDTSKADDGDPRKKENAAAKKASAKEAAAGDPYAVEERENYTYRFLGAQYRAHIVPKFLVESFVKQGGGLTSHEVGIHYEIRRGGMSVIPSLSYIEYGTSKDILFLEKGKPEGVEGNWSVINSSLKSVNGQVDVLWSARIDKGVDFEYGLGVGMGVVFVVIVIIVVIVVIVIIVVIIVIIVIVVIVVIVIAVIVAATNGDAPAATITVRKGGVRHYGDGNRRT